MRVFHKVEVLRWKLPEWSFIFTFGSNMVCPSGKGLNCWNKVHGYQLLVYLFPHNRIGTNKGEEGRMYGGKIEAK